MHVKTLREISDILGVSAETVRQIEFRALRYMKAAVATEEEVMIA